MRESINDRACTRCFFLARIPTCAAIPPAAADGRSAIAPAALWPAGMGPFAARAAASATTPINV